MEWASASAPDANIELSSCANSRTVSGLDLAILNLLDLEPPDIISDSYGLCETITGQAEVALENREAQIATALGTTFFIAQGDTGADECSPVEGFFSHLGINSGDNTASAYAVDVGGTDFMAQYNSDAHGIPVSDYWSATNDPLDQGFRTLLYSGDPLERWLHQPAHLQRSRKRRFYTVVWSNRILQYKAGQGI